MGSEDPTCAGGSVLWQLLQPLPSTPTVDPLFDSKSFQRRGHWAGTGNSHLRGAGT